MTSTFTLLYVGTSSCPNCRAFEREWEVLRTMERDGGLETLSVRLMEWRVETHSQLPPSLRNTVSFYPFLILVPTYYLEENLEGDVVLVGEALYAYKKISEGNLEYKFCENVNDYSSMRYPRTSDGVYNWMDDVGIPAMHSLAPRFYPGLVENMEGVIRQRAMRNAKYIDWKEESERFSEDMMIIPSLDKVYSVVSGGDVIHRRLRNSH